MKGKTFTLDEEIVIPNWDTSKLSVGKMRTLSDFLDKRPRKRS